MLGPIGLGIKGVVIFFKFILKYWWVFVTLIILLPGFMSSISEGREQEDYRIPLKFIGENIVSADQGIYEVIQDAEFKESKGKEPMEQLDYYFKLLWFLVQNLWRNLWMIFFFFLLFFKGERFLMGDSSKNLRAFSLAVLTMVLLQIMVYGVPFKGFYSLIKFIMGAL